MLRFRNVAFSQAETAPAVSGRVIRVWFRPRRYGPGITGPIARKTAVHEEQNLLQLRRAFERRMPSGDQGTVG